MLCWQRASVVATQYKDASTAQQLLCCGAMVSLLVSSKSL
jgi:hypothetical protein